MDRASLFAGNDRPPGYSRNSTVAEEHRRGHEAWLCTDPASLRPGPLSVKWGVATCPGKAVSPLLPSAIKGPCSLRLPRGFAVPVGLACQRDVGRASVCQLREVAPAGSC